MSAEKISDGAHVLFEWRCDECQKPLYRSDAVRLRGPLLLPNGECHIPFLLTVQERRLVFCSHDCTVNWVFTRKDHELQSGYPL